MEGQRETKVMKTIIDVLCYSLGHHYIPVQVLP